MSDLTEAALADLEALHADDHGHCPACRFTRHPCDVRQLVAEVRRLRALLGATGPAQTEAAAGFERWVRDGQDTPDA